MLSENDLRRDCSGEFSVTPNALRRFVAPFLFLRGGGTISVDRSHSFPVPICRLECSLPRHRLRESEAKREASGIRPIHHRTGVYARSRSSISGRRERIQVGKPRHADRAVAGRDLLRHCRSSRAMFRIGRISRSSTRTGARRRLVVSSQSP